MFGGCSLSSAQSMQPPLRLSAIILAPILIIDGKGVCEFHDKYQSHKYEKNTVGTLLFGGYSLSAQIMQPPLRTGANLLAAPNLPHRPTQVSARIYRKENFRVVYFRNLGKKWWRFLLVVVLAGKCVHDKVAEAVLPPLSHHQPQAPRSTSLTPNQDGERGLPSTNSTLSAHFKA